MKNESSWCAVIAQERLIAAIQKTKNDSFNQKEAIAQKLSNGDSIQQQLQDELTAKKGELTNNAQSFVNFDTKYDTMRHQFEEKNVAYMQKLKETNGLATKKSQLESDVAQMTTYLTERTEL